ncbi:MAG TPA: hypothetical protein VL051_14555, partial [Burkholderiaceae bacterium]|nr:hypothetical protein [Burkholderiaceae bacterium]
TLHSGRASDAAVVLPLLGLFLLMPPIITLFASQLDLGGIPLIAIYVFGVWAALIVCAALLAQRLDPGQAAPIPGTAPVADSEQP